MRNFKDFVLYKEEEQKEQETTKKDWKKQYIQLEKGFVPPPKMRPIIEAFLKSKEIEVMQDTTKKISMPKKSLFLTGGSVRDFLKGKTVSNYHLVTDATPSQIALILHDSGFKKEGDIGNLKLTFHPRLAKSTDFKTWSASKLDVNGKPYAIIATYKGEDFEIATFRKEPKSDNVSVVKDFVDNPNDDAQSRDFTMNALYLDLTKSDGENTKLYDPTEKGWHDVKNNVVRAIGDAEKRFKEDPIRAQRALRLHSKFGQKDLDPDIEKSLQAKDVQDLKGVKPENIRGEFLKGLLNQDTDAQKYMNLYKKSNLINKVFPGLKITDKLPADIKRDKATMLAWLLQNNSPEELDGCLSTHCNNEKTGWAPQDKRAIMFLLGLKDFSPQNRPDYLRAWKGTGLSKDQLHGWADSFQSVDDEGNKKHDNPQWASIIKIFADNDNPLVGPMDIEHLPPEMRRGAADELEISKFQDLLPKM